MIVAIRPGLKLIPDKERLHATPASTLALVYHIPTIDKDFIPEILETGRLS